MFSSVGLVVTYAGIVIAITNKTFGLIHHVPDKVLRWVGGQGEQFGEASRQDLQKTEQSFQKGSNVSEQAATAAFSGVEKLAKNTTGGKKPKLPPPGNGAGG